MRHTCPWHFTISLSDNTENCLLPALLESKHMNVTVYSSWDYFTIIHTTKGFNEKRIKFHMCPSTLFIYSFIYLCFLWWFSTQYYFGSMPGGGGGGAGCSFVGMATGRNSDIQLAKKWRTVGQNLTYAGLKSDIWATKQHWSVIVE